MAEPGKISPSKITTYKGCPLAYFLKYVEHVKVPDNVRLVFGKRIHYLLDRFYEVNFKSPDSFAGFWFGDWRRTISGEHLRGKAKRELQVKEYPYMGRDEHGNKVEKILKVGNHVDLGDNPVGVFFGYSNLGSSILKRFFERHKQKPPPLERERAFGKRKDEPLEINGHPVTGVFDRIDEMSGEFYITDYKTDKASPGNNSFILHRHPQFTFYSMAFRMLFGKAEKALLFYHLRTGQVFQTFRSEKDFDYVKRLIDEVVDGVTRNQFTPFYGFHCNFCDYQCDACEKYSMPHHGGPRIDLEGKIKTAESFPVWNQEVPDWIEIQGEE